MVVHESGFPFFFAITKLGTLFTKKKLVILT